MPALALASAKHSAGRPFDAASKRAKADAAKVKKTVERFRRAQDAKKQKREEDIRATVDALDKIARAEVQQLGDLFSEERPELESDSEFYTELDSVIVFKEDK